MGVWPSAIGVAGAARLRGEKGLASLGIPLRLEGPPRGGLVGHVADLVRVLGVGLGDDDADLLLGLRPVSRPSRPAAP